MPPSSQAFTGTHSHMPQPCTAQVQGLQGPAPLRGTRQSHAGHGEARVIQPGHGFWLATEETSRRQSDSWHAAACAGCLLEYAGMLYTVYTKYPSSTHWPPLESWCLSPRKGVPISWTASCQGPSPVAAEESELKEFRTVLIPGRSPTSINSRDLLFNPWKSMGIIFQRVRWISKKTCKSKFSAATKGLSTAAILSRATHHIWHQLLIPQVLQQPEAPVPSAGGQRCVAEHQATLQPCRADAV